MTPFRFHVTAGVIFITQCTLFYLAASPCRATEAADAPSKAIGEVDSLASLREQPARKTGDGWSVRLGIGKPGPAAGAWRLFYCLARRTNPVGSDQKPQAARTRENGQPLGPVVYRVTDGGKWPRTIGALHSVELPNAVDKALYCGLIQTGWPGRYVVTVTSLDDEKLATSEFVVTKPPANYWHTFAESQRGEGGSRIFVVRSDPFAATVGFLSLAPIWTAKKGQNNRLLRETPLPGRLPADDAWLPLSPKQSQIRAGDATTKHLRLTLQDGTFFVRANGPLLDWPDYHLLARWWIGGRPIEARCEDSLEMISIGRKVSHTNTLAVRAGFPRSFGPLPVGETIGLQLLYTPAMYRQLVKTRNANHIGRLISSGQDDSIRVPLLSNRLDFVVTQQMLDSDNADARR